MSDRPVAVDADETAHNDDLPLPVVKYPSHYGAFIAFKPGDDAELHFCSCAREAIENYIQFKQEDLQGSHRDVSIENVLNSDFPEETKEFVKEAGIEEPGEIVDALRFEEGLCHECNAVVPNRRYCADMYGTVFKQNYGWYIFQKHYEYGIYQPKSTTALADANIENLPGEIIDVIDEDLLEDLEAKAERYDELREKRFNRQEEIRANKKDAIRSMRNESDLQRGSEAYYRELEEIRETYDSMDPLPADEQAELDALKEELSESSKRVSDTIENEVRQALGHYEKGNRWTSETLLYQLIQSKYGDEYTIERHHRPEWLDGLELDIFLVEPSMGIEYQGVQHYEAVDHWGGEEGLKERQERDRRTRELCAEHGVDLVEVRHDDGLSQELIESQIEPLLNE